jgi:pimeloyl-ACP methyl ester carboxylesterase
MHRRQLLALLTLPALTAHAFAADAATASTTSASQTPTGVPMTNAARSPHASVNGVNLYYEIHGSGRPLVLLHGGVQASEVFGPNLAALAAKRQVIAVHLQGHGHTPDVERPLRFEDMADDVAALAAHLGLKKIDVLGYSLGGGVAQQVAIRHPDLVGRLVVVSQVFKRAGWYPEVLGAFDAMTAHAPVIAQNIAQSPMAKMYPEVKWEALLRKIGELESRDYDWTAQLASLKARTLLVFADADAMRPEHMVEFYKLLGGGRQDAGMDGSHRPASQWAVIPNTTHYNLLATDAVAKVASDFLDH